MLDIAGAELVFGVVRAGTDAERAVQPNVAPVPFIHAWVEYGGEVYSAAQINGPGDTLRPVSREVFYRELEVRKTWRLSHRAFMLVASRYRLASALKHGSDRAGKGELTDALLRAAGVRYKLSDRRTVLPA